MNGEFILFLLHSATNAHLLHLRSRNYAEHMALAAFYEAIPGLADDLAESIQGMEQKLIEYPVDYYEPADNALDEILALDEYVRSNRDKLPDSSEIQNKIDEIQELINSTAYKLKFLA